eukprot:gene33697-40763_t
MIRTGLSIVNLLVFLALSCLLISAAKQTRRRSRQLVGNSNDDPNVCNYNSPSPLLKFVRNSHEELNSSAQHFHVRRTARLGNAFEFIRAILMGAVCCRGTAFLLKAHQALPVPYRYFDFSGEDAYQYFKVETNSAIDMACLNLSSRLMLTWPYCRFDQLKDLERFAILNLTYPAHCDTVETLNCPKQVDFRDSLVVQLRSGDVFSSNPHPLYYQPPLAMYEYILGLREWRQVIFVTSEETLYELTNPVWHHFKFLYDKREILNISAPYVFQSSTNIEEDILFLRCAHYIAAAYSSLKEYYAYHAPFLKDLWLPDMPGFDKQFCSNKQLRGVNCHILEMPKNYIVEYNTKRHHAYWHASPLQRALMLTVNNASDIREWTGDSVVGG